MPAMFFFCAMMTGRLIAPWRSAVPCPPHPCDLRYAWPSRGMASAGWSRTRDGGQETSRWWDRDLRARGAWALGRQEGPGLRQPAALRLLPRLDLLSRDVVGSSRCGCPCKLYDVPQTNQSLLGSGFVRKARFYWSEDSVCMYH